MCKLHRNRSDESRNQINPGTDSQNQIHSGTALQNQMYLYYEEGNGRWCIGEDVNGEYSVIAWINDGVTNYINNWNTLYIYILYRQREREK